MSALGDLLRSRQVLSWFRMASQQELQQFGICLSVETLIGQRFGVRTSAQAMAAILKDFPGFLLCLV
jgi:hypothetical protein